MRPLARQAFYDVVQAAERLVDVTCFDHAIPFRLTDLKPF
jgi:hypothetical protein